MRFSENNGTLCQPPTSKLAKWSKWQCAENDIGGAQNFMEILVHASFWLCLHVVEGRIDIGSRRTI